MIDRSREQILDRYLSNTALAIVTRCSDSKTRISKIKPFRSAAYVLEESWLLGSWHPPRTRASQRLTLLSQRTSHSCMCFPLQTTLQQASCSRVAAPDCLIVEAFLPVHVHNHDAMCQSHVAIRHREPQPCLNLMQFSGIFHYSIYLARTLRLTMLRLQKYFWTSKTRLHRKHQANKQLHGLGTLLN